MKYYKIGSTSESLKNIHTDRYLVSGHHAPESNQIRNTIRYCTIKIIFLGGGRVASLLVLKKVGTTDIDGSRINIVVIRCFRERLI